LKNPRPQFVPTWAFTFRPWTGPPQLGLQKAYPLGPPWRLNFPGEEKASGDNQQRRLVYTILYTN